MTVVGSSTDFNTVAFVSFESEFAPVGGLKVVMERLPRQMARMYPDKSIVLITPFFSHNPMCASALTIGTIQDTGYTFEVFYRGKAFHTHLLSFEEDLGDGVTFKIYLVRAKFFFLAPDNPYINPDMPQRLFEDSCFLSTAVPEVLRTIPEKPPFLVNLEDWETALVAKLMPSSIPAKCVITLHNPYDYSCEMIIHQPRPRLDEVCGFGELANLGSEFITMHSTVLKIALPDVTGISTVSDNFAQELVNDSLQKHVFTPHLQEVFLSKGIVPTTNGFFKDPDPQFAQLTSPTEILEYKNQLRADLVSILDSPEGREMQSHGWGSGDLTDPRVPVFLLFGRDDPRQKGLDLAAKAIRSAFDERGPDFARFVFTPIPGVQGLDSISYLQQLAGDFPTSILVFPFRMKAGYSQLQASASYFMMPSFYEPFGGANEGYASGVPVLGRATGGLVQQICPYNYGELPEDVQGLVDQYHPQPRQPTGFLYKEDLLQIHDVVGDWQGIIDAKFLSQDPIGDAIVEREQYPLYNAMATAAKGAILAATDLYVANQAEYAQLIPNGFHLLGNFSWEATVERYMHDLYSP